MSYILRYFVVFRENFELPVTQSDMSVMSSGFILWEPSMSLLNLVTIHQMLFQNKNVDLTAALEENV